MKIFLTICFLFGSGTLLADWSVIRCKGGEKSQMSERWCEPEQWLVSFNEEATFIAKLNSAEALSFDDSQYFEIIPKDHISSSWRRFIGRYWVRFDRDGLTHVEGRFPKGFIYGSHDFDESI